MLANNMYKDIISRAEREAKEKEAQREKENQEYLAKRKRNQAIQKALINKYSPSQQKEPSASQQVKK